MFNSPEGFICTDSSENSITNFFNKVNFEIKKNNTCGVPKFIHISNGAKSRVYFDSETAKKEFEECPYQHHMIQRYIRVGGNSAWKVGVDWQEGCMKYFTLTNNSPFEKRKNSLLGKRHKSLKAFQIDDVDRFIIKTNSPKTYHIVTSLQPIIQLKDIVKQLVPIILSFVMKRKKVKEIMIDFIKESSNLWYFAGVTGYLIEGDVKNSVTLVKQRISNDPGLKAYPAISISQAKTPSSSSDSLHDTKAQIEQKRINRISRRFTKTSLSFSKMNKTNPITFLSIEDQCALYLSQKKSDNYGRIPFNMIGIVPQKLGSHLTSFIETKRGLIKNTQNLNEPPIGMYLTDAVSVKSNGIYLQEISQKLDAKMSSSIEMKKKNLLNISLRNITDSQGDVLESVFFEFLERAKTVECLSEFFLNMSQSSVQAKVNGFIQMLKGSLTKIQIGKLHEKVRIDENQFNEFIRVLSDTLSEFSVPDAYLILSKFSIHHDDIIQNN